MLLPLRMRLIRRFRIGSVATALRPGAMFLKQAASSSPIRFRSVLQVGPHVLSYVRGSLSINVGLLTRIYLTLCPVSLVSIRRQIGRTLPSRSR